MVLIKLVVFDSQFDKTEWNDNFLKFSIYCFLVKTTIRRSLILLVIATSSEKRPNTYNENKIKLGKLPETSFTWSRLLWSTKKFKKTSKKNSKVYKFVIYRMNLALEGVLERVDKNFSSQITNFGRKQEEFLILRNFLRSFFFLKQLKLTIQQKKQLWQFTVNMKRWWNWFELRIIWNIKTKYK